MTAKEFIYSIPEKAHADAIEGLKTNFHFELEGDGGGDFTLVVENGTATIEEGLQGDPRCTVKAKAKNFMKVINKEMNPMMALMMGKVKVSNQGELMKFAKIIGML